jgi:hypothetical protein
MCDNTHDGDPFDISKDLADLLAVAVMPDAVIEAEG